MAPVAGWPRSLPGGPPTWCLLGAVLAAQLAAVAWSAKTTSWSSNLTYTLDEEGAYCTDLYTFNKNGWTDGVASQTLDDCADLVIGAMSSHCSGSPNYLIYNEGQSWCLCSTGGCPTRKSDSRHSIYKFSTVAETSVASQSTVAETSVASAVGDPHLTNLNGKKFDIHDGLHRLVHYPRGVPEEEALLLVDAEAVDMGQVPDCYSVYLQSIKLSGRWIGEDIVLSTNRTPSVSKSSPDAFSVSFAQEEMTWPTLAKHHNFSPKLKGSMPVVVTTNMRNAAKGDDMGGEEIIFKVGDQHHVLVHVWSSHGKNQLTQDKEVRFLNLQVQKLPKDSGGIIGLDSYSRPSTSQCGLVQDERNLAKHIEQSFGAVSMLGLTTRRSSLQWTASAIVQQ